MPTSRTIAAAVAIVGAATIAAAPSASADTVRTGLSCQVADYGWQEAFTITVNVPATARQGDTITVTGSVTGTIARPGPRAAGAYNGALGIRVGGVTNASVTVSGMTSPAANNGDPYALVGGSGQITLSTTGTVTFSPNSAGWGVPGHPGYGWSCFDPDGNLPVAATIQVQPR